jgi:hypothetical protein
VTGRKLRRGRRRAHGGVTVQHLYDKAKDPYRPYLRQVHLVEEELIPELHALGFCVAAGDLGEKSRRGMSIWPDSAGSYSPTIRYARLRPSRQVRKYRTSASFAAKRSAISHVPSLTLHRGGAPRIHPDLEGGRQAITAGLKEQMRYSALSGNVPPRKCRANGHF